MTALVVTLWAIYLAECLYRWRPGDWMFRRGIGSACCGHAAPDFELLDGRVAFSWTTLTPWQLTYVVAGARLDARAARRRLLRLRRHTRLLRAAASALAAVILLALPALVLTGRLAAMWPLLAAPALAIWGCTAALFWHAYDRIMGEAPDLRTTVALLLSPLDLIRAPHLLAARAVRDLHPLDAASVLCEDAEFLRLAAVAPRRTGPASVCSRSCAAPRPRGGTGHATASPGG